MEDEAKRRRGRVPSGGVEVCLADGTSASLRPLTPEDKPRVREAFRRLSSESRFRRFFTPLNELDGKLLDRLTSADGVDHVVWAALAADDPDDPGLGAASFWRSPVNPEEAEFSVTVADEHQGQGIGTLLFATLWILARELGIRRFQLVALSDNTPVIEWMRSLGATARMDGDLCRLAFDLAGDAEKSVPNSYAGDELLGWLRRLPPLLFPEG